MRTQLMNALRETARKIESGEWQFNWMSVTQCNCGLVASEITGVNPWMLDIHDMNGSWKMQALYCAHTNETMPGIIQKLITVGMSVEDIGDLEYLGNQKICERAGMIAGYNHHSRQHAVKYMRAWADMIEEEDKPIEEEITVEEEEVWQDKVESRELVEA